MPLQPREIGHHAVEGDLVSSSNTNQRDDEGEVQEEHSETLESLVINRPSKGRKNNYLLSNHLVGVLIGGNQSHDAVIVRLNKEMHAIVHPERNNANEQD